MLGTSLTKQSQNPHPSRLPQTLLLYQFQNTYARGMLSLKPSYSCERNGREMREYPEVGVHVPLCTDFKNKQNLRAFHIRSETTQGCSFLTLLLNIEPKVLFQVS